jgi:hypothetical protein
MRYRHAGHLRIDNLGILRDKAQALPGKPVLVCHGIGIATPRDIRQTWTAKTPSAQSFYCRHRSAKTLKSYISGDAYDSRQWHTPKLLLPCAREKCRQTEQNRYGNCGKLQNRLQLLVDGLPTFFLILLLRFDHSQYGRNPIRRRVCRKHSLWYSLRTAS